MTTAVEDKKKEEVPIQEIEEGESSNDEEEKGEDVAAEGEDKHSRGEKKARKAISKLGLKHMPEVTRVQIRKTRAFDLTIAKPDVYRAPGSDTYIVFGAAKMQDFNQQQKQYANAAEQFKNLNLGNAAAESAAPAAAAVEDGPVDETGVDAKDIELIMSQAPSATRAQAVAALKKSNNDIVNALLSLTN
ncbi:nascent polypeptide-associated complex subunit alpha [Capsaspora owczarzaki ATCC 30864]|uniref:Nascent polypeptide-associated complex subunit alpha n=1 Tax=Capsaspora owczarzaki (strain ATCC 30864) TaxID=595528 RepID=A0A0D2WPS1_CAPO3|nr:nascent polypeptide-associated complex subunit alpha [Capsaspora owczarzaki ATCC 30864]KJE92738.1 nascent polypeptide-associated complex subunit alpha [Capsaspora owczarzaki ATCC 30864]|eukprot:XP_004363376.1 nascent polypeptide-associated complex subunit alpha [Capsaspora owczarzaki ATCC 30864]